MVLQIQISCEMLRNETIGHGSHIRSLVPVFQMVPRGEKYQSTSFIVIPELLKPLLSRQAYDKSPV
jgi:hypothetical protein